MATITLTDTRKHILDVAEDLMARKGYTAVGVNEVLTTAGVPKGSFYYHFGSKDAFGEAMLEQYFRGYLANMDTIAGREDLSGVERLMMFWQQFYDKQSIDDCQGRCLVVKLAAEVSDLSEPMRLALKVGTAGIIDRIEHMLLAGHTDRSVNRDGNPHTVAASLYASWVGASVLAKVNREPESLDIAMTATRALLFI